MTNCIFFVFIASLILNFSIGSMRYFGVSRTFDLTYKGVLEVSTNDLDENGTPVAPYFIKEKLEKNAESYYQMTIPNYTKNYTTAYYYFNPEDMTYCTSLYCRGVRISLKAKINILFEFCRAKEYMVRKFNG